MRTPSTMMFLVAGALVAGGIVGYTARQPQAEVFRVTVPNDPVANCRGPDGCSIDGPLVNTAWRGKALRILATGPNGELLASHSE